MNAAAKLTAFAGALAVLAAAGAAAGAALDPGTPGAPAAGAHGSAPAHEAPAGEHAGMAGMAGDAVRGLAVAQDGLRLSVQAPGRTAGQTRPLAFRILNGSGAAVRDFDVAHEKRMHVVVVRRDLTEFQHLHPAIAADGTWTTALRLTEPGSYRLFADFTRGGKPVTLATDLRASGNATLKALPAPARTADAGGLTVARQGLLPAAAVQETTLDFTATASGKAAALQRYLGAGGHLVALREGDLAFLHVHPTDNPAAWRAGRVQFETTFPTPGRYRLFLQVQVDGQVQTAAFTQEVK